MIYQDASEDLGSYCKEVCAVLPIGMILIHHSKIRFVNKARGLKSVAGIFLPHIACRTTPQLRIHERHERVESGAIALTPLRKQCCDINRGCVTG